MSFDFASLRARLLAEVAARGYAVLPPTPGLDAEAAAQNPWGVAGQLLGETSMVERQPIKPVAHGRSFASNSALTPLHTDSQLFGGVSPHVQLMFCARAARDGGTTLLVDTYALLETIEAEDPPLFRALFTEQRRIPFIFGDVLGPTVSWRAGCMVFTHSPKLTNDALAGPLQGFLSRARLIEVPVHDGELLVVDNHRLLHGRTAFTDPSRMFSRLLVWRRAGFSQHARFSAIAQVEAKRAHAQCKSERERRLRGLVAAPDEDTEHRRRIVLEMLRGVPPGVLAERFGIAEPLLYVWRDVAVAAMERALDKEEPA